MSPNRSTLRRWQYGVATALFTLLCSCQSLKKAPLFEEPLPPPMHIDPAAVYTLACPDVVELIFDDWPDLDRFAKVGPDGCIEIDERVRVLVEGDTIAEAAQKVAAQLRMPLANVHVRVAEHNSRQLYLFGQVPGNARAVPYHGPETVVDVLRRTGGLNHDAASNEIYIVRSQVSEAKPAEVLAVDLAGIRERRDHRTNYRVQPQDEIYIGTKPGSTLAKAVPPIFKPVYETVRQLFQRVD